KKGDEHLRRNQADLPVELVTEIILDFYGHGRALFLREGDLRRGAAALPRALHRPRPDRLPISKKPPARGGFWSERPDLNRRPFVPQTNALPGCATPRLADDLEKPDFLCKRVRPLNSQSREFHRSSACLPATPFAQGGCEIVDKGPASVLWRPCRKADADEQGHREDEG